MKKEKILEIAEKLRMVNKDEKGYKDANGESITIVDIINSSGIVKLVDSIQKGIISLVEVICGNYVLKLPKGMVIKGSLEKAGLSDNMVSKSFVVKTKKVEEILPVEIVRLGVEFEQHYEYGHEMHPCDEIRARHAFVDLWEKKFKENFYGEDGTIDDKVGKQIVTLFFDREAA